MASKIKYKYTAPSADDVKKRAEQKGGRYDSPIKSSFDSWRPKSGENTIRILPPTWDGHNHYGFEIWLHKYIGADNSNYLCLQKMKGKNCPICDAAKEAKDAGETDEAKKLVANKNYACWVIDRDDDDAQPQVFIMSWLMDRDIAALCHMKRSGKVLHIDHPDMGYDLNIKRTGESVRTRYLPSVERDETPISDDRKDQDRIMQYIIDNPIPETLNYYKTDYLEKVLAGSESKEDEEESSDTETRSDRRSRRGRHKEPASDEPASDEPASDEPKSDEPASDEPASDKKPRRSRRSKEPASDEPTSDEPKSDEPTSDEPASDKPTRGRRSKNKEPASDEPASDEPKSDEPKSDEPASDEPASDEPRGRRSKRRGKREEDNGEEAEEASDKKERKGRKGKEDRSDEPASDEPSSEAKSDEPASDEPRSDEPASDKPTRRSRRGSRSRRNR